MKDYFKKIGRDPDEVDYLEYLTGYSIDGDEYYGTSGDYVSYEDFESMYAEDGTTDGMFTYEYWASGDIDDPYATIDDQLW